MKIKPAIPAFGAMLIISTIIATLAAFVITTTLAAFGLITSAYAKTDALTTLAGQPYGDDILQAPGSDEGIQYQVTGGTLVSDTVREFRINNARNGYWRNAFAGWVPGTCDNPDGFSCRDEYEPGNPQPDTNAPRAIFNEVTVKDKTVAVRAKVLSSPFKDHIQAIALISPRWWENHWETADCIRATKEESVACDNVQFWTSVENIKGSDGQFLTFSGGTSFTSEVGQIGLMFQTTRGSLARTILVGPHLTIPLRDFWMLQGQALFGVVQARDIKSPIWKANVTVTGYRDFGDSLLFGPHIGISSINTKSAALNNLTTGYRIQKNAPYLQGDVIFNLRGGKPDWKGIAGFDIPLADNLKLNLAGSAIIGNRKPTYGTRAELSWTF